MAADGVHTKARKEVALTEPALESARFGLAKAWPRRSAHRRLSARQATILIALGLGCACTSIWQPAWMTIGVHGWLYAVFAACAVLRLASALGITLETSTPAREWRGPLPVYTVLCPMFREAQQVPRLVEALARLDYPHELLDVKLLLEADDETTLAAARAQSMPPWLELIVLAPCAPRTKPKALNAGLAQARGRFLTVYDAEDSPAPGQLREALNAFASGGADLAGVQAPLVIDNAADSWISGQFALEYVVQFRGQGPVLNRLGCPFPLGGSSNHFRTEALRASGGWDAFNVTEDADIGFRLARDGWRFGVLRAPTYEEAPITLPAWLRQRSRWIKGHLQTWLVLMRNPRLALRELGLAGFVTLQITIAGAVLSALCGAPATLALMFGLIAFPQSISAWDLSLAGFATLAAASAGAIGAIKLRQPALAWAVLSLPAYYCLAFPAACIALYEMVLKPFYWAKTTHGLGSRHEKSPRPSAQPTIEAHAEHV